VHRIHAEEVGVGLKPDLQRSSASSSEYSKRASAASREDGEIEATADPQVLAMIASAVLYTLAIRSRAGESRAILRSVVATTIDLICGRAPARKGRQRT
jgi:hypothetical protein